MTFLHPSERNVRARESSPRLIHPRISMTQSKNTAIYKLMHYLWSKVSREDSSAQQGRISRGCVKFCEWGSRSGTQNLVEGLFLWAPAAFAQGLFSQSLLLPPSLPSPQRMSAESKQSLMWHTYSTAMPVPSPPGNEGKWLRTVLAWGIYHGANLIAMQHQ